MQAFALQLRAHIAATVCKSVESALQWWWCNGYGVRLVSRVLKPIIGTTATTHMHLYPKTSYQPSHACTYAPRQYSLAQVKGQWSHEAGNFP